MLTIVENFVSFLEKSAETLEKGFGSEKFRDFDFTPIPE